MSLENIQLWHKRARPEPTYEDFNVQLGCHFEEIVEMLDSLVFNTDEHPEMHKALTDTYEGLTNLADALKCGKLEADIARIKDFLDSAADQVVTVIGVAHCAGMDGAEAVNRVNTSNWSKFDEHGQPIFNEHGKIAKGPKYAPPNLEGLY